MSYDVNFYKIYKTNSLTLRKKLRVFWAIELQVLFCRSLYLSVPDVSNSKGDDLYRYLQLLMVKHFTDIFFRKVETHFFLCSLFRFKSRNVLRCESRFLLCIFSFWFLNHHFFISFFDIYLFLHFVCFVAKMRCKLFEKKDFWFFL